MHSAFASFFALCKEYLGGSETRSEPRKSQPHFPPLAKEARRSVVAAKFAKEATFGCIIRCLRFRCLQEISLIVYFWRRGRLWACFIAQGQRSTRFFVFGGDWEDQSIVGCRWLVMMKVGINPSKKPFWPFRNMLEIRSNRIVNRSRIHTVK